MFNSKATANGNRYVREHLELDRAGRTGAVGEVGVWAWKPLWLSGVWSESILPPVS